MKCPYCDSIESRVIDSRPIEQCTSIRRRRECVKCGKRFTTFERIENIPLIVIKKNGERVPFDKNKLLGGMIKACEKRPVPVDVIQKVANDIEKSLYRSEAQEVSSVYIGERVMGSLKDIDQIAYVRFASVYRQFQDVGTFMAELERLMSEKSEEDH